MNILLRLKPHCFAQLYLKFYGEISFFYFFGQLNAKIKNTLCKNRHFFHLSAICRHHQRKVESRKYVGVHERNYKSCMTSAGGLYRSPCCLVWHIERFSSRGCTNGINVVLVSFRARFSGAEEE